MQAQYDHAKHEDTNPDYDSHIVFLLGSAYAVRQKYYHYRFPYAPGNGQCEKKENDQVKSVHGAISFRIGLVGRRKIIFADTLGADHGNAVQGVLLGVEAHLAVAELCRCRYYFDTV